MTSSNSQSLTPTTREVLPNRELLLLERMLRIYSPSREEAVISAFLVEEMKSMGFQAYGDGVNNAIGILGGGKKTIILLGHMDTVSGQIPVEIREGRLFGRGAVDAKGALACFICAALRLRKEIASLDRKIVVIGAVEEEAATSLGAHQAVKDFDPPDFCMVGEPSGWSAITLGYKGRVLVDYRLEISSKHSAGKGKLVCEQAVDFWNGIRSWCERVNEGKGAFETIDPSIRCFNSEHNGLTEVAYVKMGFRLPAGFSLPDFKSLLQTQAGSKALLSFSGDEAAVRTGKSNPLVKAFLQAIRARGGQPRFKVKTGTADMNVVAPYWKCPTVAYGPGDSTLDHTPEEHIEIAEYSKAIDVLESVLRTL
jgi:[amino group carrier protein]-lysine/ornithine hydrolase